MSMHHKAYAFKWAAFEQELLPIVERALGNDDAAELARFISENQAFLQDPYEGEPLPRDWRAKLEVGDVQELADIALTRYYDPSADSGLGHDWVRISHASAGIAGALLGQTIGPDRNPFDPGRMGRTFSDPIKCASRSS